MFESQRLQYCQIRRASNGFVGTTTLRAAGCAAVDFVGTESSRRRCSRRSSRLPTYKWQCGKKLEAVEEATIVVLEKAVVGVATTASRGRTLPRSDTRDFSPPPIPACSCSRTSAPGSTPRVSHRIILRRTCRQVGSKQGEKHHDDDRHKKEMLLQQMNQSDEPI